MRRVAALSCLLVSLSCFGVKQPVPAVGGPPCSSDADCVVACPPGEDCCYAESLCGCEQVVHRDQAEAWNDWAKRWCDGRDHDCPVADCDKPDYRVEARCVAGACQAKRIPR